MTLREPEIERKPELKPKVVAGRFSLIGPVGNGYYTQRYRAKDMQDNDRPISLKSYDWRSHFTEIGCTLFKWHVENVIALDPHPNIIPTRLVGGGEEDGERLYVIQDHIDGVPASAWVKSAQTPKIAVERLIHVLEGVCEALQWAMRRHELQYCLKPGDVLVENGTDTVKVGDIGVYANNLSYMSIKPCCSRYCMNPVPILTDYWDARMQGFCIEPNELSCIYALGILAYEMATGKPPFGRRDVSVLKEYVFNRIPPVAEHSSFPLPGWLVDFINKCLEKDPGLRYQDAQCAAMALKLGRKIDAQPNLAHRIFQVVRKAFSSAERVPPDA